MRCLRFLALRRISRIFAIILAACFRRHSRRRMTTAALPPTAMSTTLAPPLKCSASHGVHCLFLQKYRLSQAAHKVPLWPSLHAYAAFGVAATSSPTAICATHASFVKHSNILSCQPESLLFHRLLLSDQKPFCGTNTPNLPEELPEQSTPRVVGQGAHP